MRPRSTALSLAMLLSALREGARRAAVHQLGVRGLSALSGSVRLPVNARCTSCDPAAPRSLLQRTRMLHRSAPAAAAAPQANDTAALSPHSLFEHYLADRSNDVNEVFAVVRLCGTQFKVTVGDQMWVEKMDAKVGEEVQLDDVLLVGTRQHTVVGRPTLNGVTVRAFVEEQTADKKTIVFKMKKRKGYKRTHGHRRKLTVLRVLSVEGVASYLPDDVNYAAALQEAAVTAGIDDYAPTWLNVSDDTGDLDEPPPPPPTPPAS